MQPGRQQRLINRFSLHETHPGGHSGVVWIQQRPGKRRDMVAGQNMAQPKILGRYDRPVVGPLKFYAFRRLAPDLNHIYPAAKLLAAVRRQVAFVTFRVEPFKIQVLGVDIG